MRDPTRFWASAGMRRPSRSAPPIASSPRPRIPIFIRATRRPKSGSRRSRPPTSSCPTRTSAGSTTAARSTPAAHPGCASRPIATSPRARGGVRYSGAGSFENAADLEEMIQDLFGGRAGGRTMRMRGADVGYRLEIGLGDVARAPRCRSRWRDGSSVEVTIPRASRRAGAAPEGQGWRRYRRRATGRCPDRDPGAAPSGFERKDADIHLALPLTLGEAVRGAKITVPTLHGPVAMTIPEGSSTGAVLRLKGKGLPRAGRTGVGRPVCPAGGRPAAGGRCGAGGGHQGLGAQHPYDPQGGPDAGGTGMKRLEEVLVELRGGAYRGDGLDRGGVGPPRTGCRTEPMFRPVDVARLQLIQELHHDLAIDTRPCRSCCR